MAEINEEGIIVSDNSIYVPQTWVDEVDVCTPISAERLNHMELGMCDIAERCDSLSQLEQRMILRSIKGVGITYTSGGIVLSFMDSGSSAVFEISFAFSGNISFYKIENGKITQYFVK